MSAVRCRRRVSARTCAGEGKTLGETSWGMGAGEDAPIDDGHPSRPLHSGAAIVVCLGFASRRGAEGAEEQGKAIPGGVYSAWMGSALPSMGRRTDAVSMD